MYNNKEAVLGVSFIKENDMSKKNSDANNGNNFDKAAMLDAYIAKFGLGPIMSDAIGDIDPDMTLTDFMNHVESKGVMEVVSDMTLKDLFGFKPKGTKPSVLKKKVLEVLEDKSDLTTSEIAEEIGEGGKSLSVALSTLKKDGAITSKGEKKRSMKYSLANQ